MIYDSFKFFFINDDIYWHFSFNYVMQLLEIAQVPDDHVSSCSILPLFPPLLVSFAILISLRRSSTAFRIQNSLYRRQEVHLRCLSPLYSQAHTHPARQLYTWNSVLIKKTVIQSWHYMDIIIDIIQPVRHQVS